MCPSEDDVLAFLERRLSGPRAAALEGHVDACASCRQLVGALSEELGEAPAEADAPRAGLLWPGDRVGGFTVEALIGRGGMGDVYAARDAQLHRRVALKLINDALSRDREARARILVEARAMARLQHPHIAAIYAAGEHDGRPYLAMELVEGETLRQRLDREPLALTEVLEIGRAMALAVAEAHRHQVLHRDLKPQNVMIGRDGRVRVLDFGLAKLRPTEHDPGTAASLESHEPTVRGTPAYIAPEHWRGERAGEPADVWALGVVLYELVAGRRPYQETSAISYALRVSDPQPVPPSTVAAGTPEGLVALIGRCLAKDPAQRPTAQAAADALAELAGAEPLQVVARLVRAASEWERGGASHVGLWDGELLTHAERVLAHSGVSLSASAARFLTASAERARRRSERQSRRRLVLSWIAGTSAVAALLLAGASWRLTERARRGEAAATAARAAALVEGARAAGAELEARAKLRSGLELADALPARALWAELEGAPLAWTRALGSAVFDAAWSPDGEALAVGAQDRTVYLVDTRTLAVRSLRGHDDQVFKVVFSRDGRWLASSSWSGEVRLWSLASGASRVLAPPGPRPQALAFTADGALLLVAVRDAPLRALPVDGGPARAFPGPGSRDLVVDARGTWWSADVDGHVRARDGEGGAPRVEVPIAGASALAVAGDRVAVGTDGGALHLLSLAGEPHGELGAHHGTVVRVRAAAGGRWLTLAEDKVARLWSPSGRAFVTRALGAPAGALWGLAVDPSGARAVIGGVDGDLRAWDLAAREAVPEGAPHDDGVTSVAFGDGVLYSGGYDRAIRVWDRASGAPLGALVGHEGTVYGLSWRAGTLASAGHDGTVRLWRAVGGAASAGAVLTGHAGGVYAVALDTSASRVLSAGADGTVRLWRTSGGASRVIAQHEGAAFAVAWSPDGARVASGGADKRVWITDPAGRAARALVGHEGSVWGVAFSPSGAQVASGAFDRTVRLWDLPSGQSRVIARLDARVYSVAFTPDGSALVVASADGAVHQLALDGPSDRVLRGHRAEVNQVRVSDDGRWAASASDDGTVRLWSLERGWPEWRDRGARPDAARADRRGEWLCAASLEGALELWRGDRRLFSAPECALGAVRALDGACVALAGGAARLYDAAGAPRTLAEGATAVTVDAGGRAWVAAGDRLLGFDGAGRAIGERAADAGATALAPLEDGAWALGYDNGRVALVSSDGRARELEGTPRGRVERLVAAPEGTLLAGWASGELGLWSVDAGARLLRARLHGPISALAVVDGRVTATSELGGQLAGLDVFGRDRCATLRAIWSRVPVIWKDGRAVVAPPPEGHPCTTP